MALVLVDSGLGNSAFVCKQGVESSEGLGVSEGGMGVSRAAMSFCKYDHNLNQLYLCQGLQILQKTRDKTDLTELSSAQRHPLRRIFLPVPVPVVKITIAAAHCRANGGRLTFVA